MSDKTNDEKLRILQERLATIQQKKEIQQEEKIQQNKPVAPVFEEELVNHPNIDPIAKTPRQPRNNSSLFKYFILSFIILLVGYGGFYAYENIDYFNSLFKSSNTTIGEDDIIYNKSSFDGNFIIILKDFNEKELADAEAQSLNDEYKFKEEEKIFKVLQLSGVSNSKKEVFQIYIGSFNKEEEANQNLDMTELEGVVIELQ